MTSTTSNGLPISPIAVAETFKTQVIDRVAIRVAKKTLGYAEYLALPDTQRTNDEANAVDQQFAQYCLEWLGFDKGDWAYNLPQNRQKASNRPDFVLFGSVGPAVSVSAQESKGAAADAAAP